MNKATKLTFLFIVVLVVFNLISIDNTNAASGTSWGGSNRTIMQAVSGGSGNVSSWSGSVASYSGLSSWEGTRTDSSASLNGSSVASYFGLSWGGTRTDSSVSLSGSSVASYFGLSWGGRRTDSSTNSI